MVVVIGEVKINGKFEHKPFWAQMKNKLSEATTYFHHDGTYWTENEAENIIGFYQTVKLRKGFYRNYLIDPKHWPSGTKITELRKFKENHL